MMPMMRGAADARAPTMTGLSAWFSAIPFATKGLLYICSGLFLFQSLFPRVLEMSHLCYNSDRVVERMEVQRLLLSPFLHGSILHILFNMSALLSFCPPQEQTYGSSGLIVIVGLCVLMGSGIFTGCSLILHALHGQVPSWVAGVFPWKGCMVGFSGVLFSLLTLRTRQDPEELIGLFCVSVPAYIYPIVLMALIQLLFPNAALGGHLAGVLAGYCLHHILRQFSPDTRTGKVAGFIHHHMPRLASTHPKYINGPFPAAAAAPSPGSSEASPSPLALPNPWAAAPGAPAQGGDTRFPGQGRSLGGGTAGQGDDAIV